MRVLVACEFSGRGRDACIRLGDDAISWDLLPTEAPGPHHEGDIDEILWDEDWDLIVAHPPCTYLCNSGVQHLHKEVGRWDKLDEGAAFFKRFLNHPCEKICVENPIPHKYAVERIGSKYTQIIQPWQFGHPERKATCLWLKGLDRLVETNNVKEEMDQLPISEQQKVFYASPGPDRWKERSVTFNGIAEAMADQWGGCNG